MSLAGFGTAVLRCAVLLALGWDGQPLILDIPVAEPQKASYESGLAGPIAIERRRKVTGGSVEGQAPVQPAGKPDPLTANPDESNRLSVQPSSGWREIFRFEPGVIESLQAKYVTRFTQVQAGSHRMGIGTGNFLPTVNDKGYLDTTMDWKPDSTTSHVMFRPDGGQAMPFGRLQLEREYLVHVSVKPTSMDWAKNISWAIPIQVWGPSYPANPKWKNPPFAIRLVKGDWVVQASPEDPLKDFGLNYRKDRFRTACKQDDFTHFTIHYKPSQVNGHLSVGINGVLVWELSGIPTTLQTKAKTGGYLMIGNYSFGTSKSNPGGFLIGATRVYVKPESFR